jgi:hypothetical protein
LRLLRNCLLSLAILVIFTSVDLNAMVLTDRALGSAPQAGGSAATTYSAFPAEQKPVMTPSNQLAPSDFYTMMAAVFAAENAALTPPIFLINMPLITR